MGFRVYDKKKKKWIDNDIYLTPNGELVESKKALFGDKLTFMSEDRYVYQQDIELYDKNNKLIYIGDYIEAEIADNKVVTGLVTYASELASYVILCFDTNEYFVLSNSVCSRIKIVGNVFDK